MPLSTDDVVEIHQLYATYSHAIDSGDGAGYAACFTVDGVMDTTVRGVFTGSAQLATVVSDPAKVMRHVPGNIVVTGDSESATGRAYLQVYSGRGGTPVMVTTGKYEDSLKKVDGRWRFSSRRFIPDQ